VVKLEAGRIVGDGTPSGMEKDETRMIAQAGVD